MIKNAGGVNLEEDIIKENLDVDERKKDDVKYRQSANTLFNFMPKIEYLYRKLEEKRIIPRYVSEDVEYLRIPNLKKLAVPMVCFCDINLHKILPHAKGYGNFSGYGCFAIAFSKEFCLGQSVQPVHYINEHSEFLDSFSAALNVALKYDNQESSDFEMVLDQLVKNVMFMKPLTGTQNEISNNFHDEQEWRFVPDFSQSNMQQLLANNEVTDKFNSAIEIMADESDYKDICFNFDYSDIKYLIIDKEENRMEFIKWIIKLKDEKVCSEEDSIDLISKIRVLDTIEEDA